MCLSLQVFEEMALAFLENVYTLEKHVFSGF